MKGNCLEIGTIQAFLDNELTHEESGRVATHIAECNACAFLVSDAEAESAVVFSALDNEYNALVPTQRLWSKINTAIDAERAGESAWHRVKAFISTALVNPSFAAAGAILIVAGLMASIWISRTAPVTVPSNQTIANGPTVSTIPQTQPTQDPIQVVSAPSYASSQVTNRDAQFVKASFTAATRPRTQLASSISTAVSIPGEDSYLKTIYSLEKAVDTQKDSVMRAGERIAYERDMAVVNNSIKRVREQVRRNPRNEAARDVLYSSYQNKIDLLNSVSSKEELVASLDQ